MPMPLPLHTLAPPGDDGADPREYWRFKPLLLEPLNGDDLVGDEVLF